MPIPDIMSVAEPEARPSSPPGDMLYLNNDINRLKAATPRLRMLAFAVDFGLLHGFSIALAQWLSVLLLRGLLPAKLTASGVAVSPQVFHVAYQYGVSLVWPAACLFFGFAYYVSCIHLWGATVGLGLAGLSVVSRAGARPSLEQAGKRFLASVFSFFSLGFFFFLGAYGRDGICFHDEASGTRVVRRDGVPERRGGNAEGGAADPQAVGQGNSDRIAA